MALSFVSVNWASVFANGTLTATGATWNNVPRLADFFLSRLATTTAAPAGESIIKVDQGATAATYLSASRLILPAGHNIGVALTLEYSPDDAAWTPVTLTPSGTPTSGAFFSATFTKVTAGSGNRYWRLRFTKIDAAVQLGEVWLTEKIVIGQSETTPGESGGVNLPYDFPIHPNIAELRTLEGVRSAVELGPAIRSILLDGSLLTANGILDWEGLDIGTLYGLRPFFIDDPRGATWFGVLAALPRSLDYDAPERWSWQRRVTEIP